MQTIKNSNSITILMLPWLAHGHISPYLELSKRLIKAFSNQNLHTHIYFCSTLANLPSIKAKTLKNPKLSGSVKFIQLCLPELPDLPPHRHTTNGLPPSLMPSLKKAFDMSSNPNFAEILETLKPDLLVYDFLQPWAPLLAAERNIPAILFMSCGASMTAFYLHLEKRPGERFPFPEIFLRDHEVSGFQKLLESSASGETDKNRVRLCCERSSNNVILLKTFAEIEGKYIDYLSALMGKKIVPVGSLVDDDEVDQDSGRYEDDEVIQWLKKRERSSVVFVSFGSEYFLSKEDTIEIAHGLELSQMSFIWVVRFPMDQKTSIEEAMPSGFLKRVEEKGMVIEGWAPQREILKNETTAAFVSHCGWSSVMESMQFGVPIVAMPMHLDQPFNARLVEEIGVGLEVERNANNGKILSEKLAETVKKVVVESGGERVREAAAEMKERMRRKGDKEMREVVKELMKMCEKKNLQVNNV